MQTTELDPTLSETLERAGKPGLTLVIGNKNYSTWSMRPWVAMTAFNIPFQEVRVALDRPETATLIAKYSSSGRVPVLLAGETAIWDSLAICEYLAEQFREKNLWPLDVVKRAQARSICAEMHSGFGDLRQAMWMNIRADFRGKGRTPGAQGDIGRVCEIWEDCMADSGAHDFLFGDFSIADAFYAPVVMRFRTYGVSLAPALQAYCDRVTAHPSVAAWIAGALAETETCARYDTYPG